MPSSTHSACYTGPTGIVSQLPTQSMHAYQYKNIGPLPGGLGSPVMPNPSPRNRLVLQDSTTAHANQVVNNSGHFGSPGPHGTTANGSYSNRSANSRGHHNPHAPQSNGLPSSNPTDIMSMSMHAPASNYHYWPAAAGMANSPNPSSNNTTPTSISTVSPYAHANLMSSGAHHYSPNPSGSVGTNDFHLKHNGTGSTKSATVNGSSTSTHSSKVNSSSGSGSRPLWKERPHVGRYSLIRTIGKGNFAKVKLAQHLTTGMQVAVKVIDKTLLNHSSMQKLFREVRVLKTLNHPNIIKLLEVIESERHLYLVMEYASGGEVFDYLVAHGKMKEADARIKFRQIVSAVQYCHQKMVVHRDLKAENLLLDADLNIKIADFGFSNYFSTSQKLDTFCGSPPYAAPELFLGRKYEGPEVDVWSLGVILYTLVSGTLPFDGKNLKELRERVLRGTYRVPFYMTHECETLLKKMLVLNPAKRLPLSEVMRDPWLNNGFDAILRPYNEPPTDYCDPERIETMVRMGFKPSEIQEALTQQRFNNITATYILLGRYDPKVHGRLPGLGNASHSTNRVGNKPDTRQGDFSLNGTIQPLPTSTGVVSHHAPRPASALPSTQHQYNSSHHSNQSRRTPDEGLFSRTAAAFTARTLQEQLAPEKATVTRSSAAPQSASSVSSSVTNPSSSSNDRAASNMTSAASRPHPTVRRSATTCEPRTSIPTSATITNIMTKNLAATADSRSSPSSSPTPPSQAPPPEFPLHQLRSSTPQPSVITVHSPAVTTAHLVLANGPSTTPTRGPKSTRNSTISNVQPTTQPAIRSSIATAPLARDEEEPSPGEAPTKLSVRRTRSKPVEKSESNTSCNGANRSHSSSSSSSDDSYSTSDVYDREVGSGSSEGSVDSPSALKDTKRRSTSPDRGTESKVTSVVLAAAPTIGSSNQSTSPHNHQSTAGLIPAANAEVSNNKPTVLDSNFVRMPSVRRKTSIRSTAEPNDSTATVSANPSARIPRPSSVDQHQNLPNSPSPKPRVPSMGSSRLTKEVTDLIRDGVVNGVDSSLKKEAQPQTKPRSLFRGPPNAADILSEANPFRLAAADNTPKPIPPAVPPHNSRAPLTPTPTSRACSPIANNNNNTLSGAIRRPTAPPPPPLATNSVTNPPNRMSYAYHSLRLPSSTTTTTIAMGKEGTSDMNNRLFPRLTEPSVNSLWTRGLGREGGMVTPTPVDASDARDLYTVPFSRNLPERSTIQHVPTGRARERLEGSSAGPRLVRHAGTHSIATQSIRMRAHSPLRPDNRDAVTPRPTSPDDLSISSVTSSISTLGQTEGIPDRRRLDDSPPSDYPPRGTSVTGRQRNTLGSPVQGLSRNLSMRPPATRDGQANGGFNNFFRTLTTRISRSKIFRRSTIMQSNAGFTDPEPHHHRLDPMNTPTMELDKVVARGCPSPDFSLKPTVNRIPRSRSGVTPHRPISQVAPRYTVPDVLEEDHRPSRKLDHTERFERRRSPTDEGRSTITRRASTRSSVSRENRSRSVQRPAPPKDDDQEDKERTPSRSTLRNSTRSKRSGQSESRKKSPSPVDKTETEGTRTFNSKTHRSMRYVLRPFARWPLDEVMLEVQRSLTNHGVDYEVVGEHKLQCVYGDPSHGCQIPSMRNSTTNNRSSSPSNLLDPGVDGGVVHWEMEIGKLAGVGMNGIRFKRINGSMGAFKQIAKKLAADLKL